MKLRDFLFARRSVLFLNIAGICALYSYLRIFDIPGLAILFIAFCWVFVCTCYFTAVFLTRRSYYSKLHDFTETTEDLSTLTRTIDMPGFADMQPFYEYIEALNEDVSKRANGDRNKHINYQEYIESWVHDIKTPIAALRLIIDSESTGQCHDELMEEIDKIEGLVEQTLYFARSENVEKDYLIKEIQVMKCVKSAITSNSALIRRKGIALDVKNSGETVFSDEKWLGFILDQIFVNAIKYSKGESPQIKIWVDKKNGSVVLNVEDNGIGIPKKDLNRIFDKGFTGESGRRYEKSTGMGLYLVKRLCDKLGHGVYADSEEGRFTRISLVFPKSSFTSF